MRTRVPSVDLPGHRVVTRLAPPKMDSHGEWWEAHCECGYTSSRTTSPSAALKFGRDHQYGILRQHEDRDFRLQAVNSLLSLDHQLTLDPVGELYRAVCRCGRYRSVAGDADAVMRLGAQHSGRYSVVTPEEFLS